MGLLQLLVRLLTKFCKIVPAGQRIGVRQFHQTPFLTGAGAGQHCRTCQKGNYQNTDQQMIGPKHRRSARLQNFEGTTFSRYQSLIPSGM